MVKSGYKRKQHGSQACALNRMSDRWGSRLQGCCWDEVGRSEGTERSWAAGRASGAAAQRA